MVLNDRGSYAQEEAELEEILSGFEDDQKSDEDLQEVIEGFDDESSKRKKERRNGGGRNFRRIR